MRWLPVAFALLVAACETGIKPTATIAAPDSADQVLLGMSHYVTNGGIQRAQVRADTAYFYSPVQTAELRNVHITFYDPRGAQTSTLTSREGRRDAPDRSDTLQPGPEPGQLGQGLRVR